MAPERRYRMRRLLHPIRDNSLSIVLFALFAICIVAQCFAGWRLQNETLVAHGLLPIGFWQNMATGSFLGGAGFQLAGRLPATRIADLVQRPPLPARRGAFARSTEADLRSRSGEMLRPASVGSSAIRYPWPSGCSSCSRSSCMSWPVAPPSTRNARSRDGRRSRSRNS